METNSQEGAASRLLLAFSCIGIAYGSLFPFIYRPLDQFTIDAFLTSFDLTTGLVDDVSNIILFLPFGFFGLLAFSRSRKNALYIFSAGFLFALGLQLAQLLLQYRHPSLTDVFFNTLGTVTGILTALIGGPWLQRFRPAGQVYAAAIPIVLISLFIASELLPFLPALDGRSLLRGIRPLWAGPYWNPVIMMLLACAWAATGQFLLLVGNRGWATRILLAAIVITLLLKILIIFNSLTWIDIQAAGLGFLIWHLLPRIRRGDLLLALAMLSTLIWLHLIPLVPRTSPQHFFWVPFGAVLKGSLMINMKAVAFKLFFYGAIVSRLGAGGLGLWRAAAATAVILTGIETLQIYFASGTPEITDPLIALMVALLFHLNRKSGSDPK